MKLFVFAMNGRRRYSIFVLYLRIRRKELKIRSCLCRLPSAVNVMLNLSIKYIARLEKFRNFGNMPIMRDRGKKNEFVINLLLRAHLYSKRFSQSKIRGCLRTRLGAIYSNKIFYDVKYI